MFHEECLHGQAAIDATSFSQPIGLGATFDPDLVERLFTMTAAEARSRGTHQALTPVVDVARDPRWGRVEETYGEDPYLVARLGIAAVQGFQGDGTFRDKQARDRHAQAFRRPRPAGVGQQLRPGEYLRARAPRDISLHVPGSDRRGRRDERDGLVQRDRRRAVARQPLAAARRAAEGVGFQGLRRLRLLRHSRAGRAAGAVRPSRGPRRQGGVPARGAGRREHRAAGARLLQAPGRAGARRARSQESELDELVAPMLDVQIPARAVRGSVRRSGGRGEARRLRRASQAGARGGPQDDHAAEERRQCRCRSMPKKLKTLAVIGPNADRELLGRLQRPAEASRRPCSKASARASAATSKCCTTKAARSRSAARGSRTT